jgi:NAD(P)-dependent dehydrogenase (short-subunit alcohol dehydrogenase family)
MRERGWGRVVNISSIAYAGELGQADYGAAKAAVASLSRSMAIEFAPQVNVNCIAPSLIRTSVVERMDAAELADLRDRTLLKRLGEADEIANAVLFFSCDESSFVTGQLLAVSGGMAVSL